MRLRNPSYSICTYKYEQPHFRRHGDHFPQMGHGMFGVFPNTFPGQLSQHWYPSQFTNPSVAPFAHPIPFLLMWEGGLENTWLIDSSCSRHMTRSSKWFSSLNPVQCKEYITFGENSKGNVLSRGTIRVNESFALKDVALVSNLHFNLLLVSQLLKDGFEVRFKTSLSRVFVSQGNLVF